jgi:hypothetical protein
MFKKKEEPFIKFSTPFKGLENIESCRPQPAKNFIPQWYTKTPPTPKDDHYTKLIPQSKTVKLCPSFTDIFHNGFVIPAHCDMYFRWTDGQEWEWATSYEDYEVQLHHDVQMKDYTPESANIKKIFKIISPWRIMTPPGYSVYQVPLFYHYNPDWYIPYGSINSDKHHIVNQQVVITSETKKQIMIKQGDPLCYYVPYKREQYNLKVETWTQEWEDACDENLLRVHSKFKGGYLKNI